MRKKCFGLQVHSVWLTLLAVNLILAWNVWAQEVSVLNTPANDTKSINKPEPFFLLEELDNEVSGGGCVATITPMAAYQTVSGSHGVGEFRDYCFSATAAGQSFDFSTCPPEGMADYDTILGVRSGDGTMLLAEVDDTPGCGLLTRLRWTASSAGNYRLRIRGYDGDGGNYVIAYRSDAQPVACPGLPEWSAEWEALEAEAFARINAHRAAGATCDDQVLPPVPPLEPHPALVCAARMHSLYMAELEFFDHIWPDGTTPADRMRWWGYEGGFTGENIAAGYPTPAAVVDGWMSSPGHCRNIMNLGYVYHGLGYYFRAESPYRAYWTSNFGGR